MPLERAQYWLFIAITLVLLGYFAPWLPHEAAGLSYIGFEMGEQAKFLPQVRSGAILPGRSLFYLPPITIALLLILISSRWSNSRWQTWVVRVLAVLVSLLALPALEALGAEPAEWLWRVILIGLVILCFMLSPLLNRLSLRTVWYAMIGVALSGVIFPGWIFFEVRDAFSLLMRQSLGVGFGFWLNSLGHLLVLAAAPSAMRQRARPA